MRQRLVDDRTRQRTEPAMVARRRVERPAAERLELRGLDREDLLVDLVELRRGVRDADIDTEPDKHHREAICAEAWPDPARPRRIEPRLETSPNALLA